MVIGIDEVGRGPLAGPVFVAAVALPKRMNLKGSDLPLRDSKKLTAHQREAWCAWIKKNPGILWAIARSSPKTIDRVNITQAANHAAHRAYLKVIEVLSLKAESYGLKAHLDAGLKLPKGIPQESIVKGDEKIPAIALASILAKVARDAYMERQAKKYPGYGWETNKGYGTAVHVKALKKWGPCNIHRLTFIRKFIKLKANEAKS